MYFCLNFDTRKEHKANAMKHNKISFCLSVLSPQARVFRTNGLKHHCHACPKCVIVVVGGDSHCSA